MTVIVIIVISLALFGLAFVSRRRFGVLGLALAAGALLANHMTGDLSKLIEKGDLPVQPLTTLSAASIFLILLPALVLLLSGPAYKKRRQTIIGSVMFSVMATLLLLGPLTISLPPDKIIQPLLRWVAEYNSVLLAIMVGLAVADAWMTHNLPSSDESTDKKSKKRRR